MTRGIIARTYPLRRSVLTLAFVGVLAAACMANSAFAGESKVGSDRALYQSANDGPASAEVSTLTNNVGQLRGSAEGQLPLGIGLLAVGLLGLVYGIAATLSTSSPSPAPTR